MFTFTKWKTRTIQILWVSNFSVLFLKKTLLDDIRSPEFNHPNQPVDRDWNAEFQEWNSKEDSPYKFERLRSVLQKKKHPFDLHFSRDLAADFAYCAQTYGAIVISELALPPESKTIKPAG